MNKKSDRKKDLNDLIYMAKKILNVLYIFLIIIGVYIVLKLANEIKFFKGLVSLLKILIPLFIGIVVAWLLNPFISWLQKKGVRRKLGVVFSYVILVGILYFIISSIIPLLYNQVIELASSLPDIFDSVKEWIDGIFDKLDGIKNFNTTATKDKVFSNIAKFSNSLYTSLPTRVLGVITSFLSGIGTFLVGLLIGFFLLMSSENVDIIALEFVPKKYKNTIKELSGRINKSLRSYVNGALIDALIVFLVSTLVFAIIGVQSPILFGLFCGITNVIPYVGPYIGGAPAVLVAFSQSPGIGVATLISLIIIQTIEGNFLQTLIISKATKLHPVTIIIGLLVFGYFFGIIGMLLSTPIISVCKVVFQYFDEKYEILNVDDDEDKNEELNENK